MKERRYGQWAGNEKGTPEDTTRCIEKVYPPSGGGSWIPHQCYRKRGYGKDGLYCKQHNKMKEEK
jgi:bacillopeptidase F (M6 metalloprotease family)